MCGRPRGAWGRCSAELMELHSRVGPQTPRPRQTVTVPRRTDLDLEGPPSRSRLRVEARFRRPGAPWIAGTRARRCACLPGCWPRRRSRLCSRATRASRDVRCNGWPSRSDRWGRRSLRRTGTPPCEVATTDGHAPMRVRGGPLRGIEHETPVPTAQVKSAVILAGLEAEGETIVREGAQTRTRRPSPRPR